MSDSLSDFGIEESFVCAAAGFEEHYHYEIGQSAAARATKNIALQAMDYIENKLSDCDQVQENTSMEKMLVELDGCEIRTAHLSTIEDSTETTAVYNNPKKEKILNWRDVRLGFVRPLDSKSKTFIGKMVPYQCVID